MKDIYLSPTKAATYLYLLNHVIIIYIQCDKNIAM